MFSNSKLNNTNLNERQNKRARIDQGFSLQSSAFFSASKSSFGLPPPSNLTSDKPVDYNSWDRHITQIPLISFLNAQPLQLDSIDRPCEKIPALQSLENIHLSFFSGDSISSHCNYYFFMIAESIQNAFVLPLDIKKYRCVIVLTREEFDSFNFLKNTQLRRYDFLVIESDSKAFKGRCDSVIMRRKAALHFSHYKKLTDKKFTDIVMIDGGVEAIHFKSSYRTLAKDLNALFGTLQSYSSPIVNIFDKIVYINIAYFYEKNQKKQNSHSSNDLLALLPEDERVAHEISYMELVSNFLHRTGNSRDYSNFFKIESGSDCHSSYPLAIEPLASPVRTFRAPGIHQAILKAISVFNEKFFGRQEMLINNGRDIIQVDEQLDHFDFTRSIEAVEFALSEFDACLQQQATTQNDIFEDEDIVEILSLFGEEDLTNAKALEQAPIDALNEMWDQEKIDSHLHEPIEMVISDKYIGGRNFPMPSPVSRLTDFSVSPLEMISKKDANTISLIGLKHLFFEGSKHSTSNRLSFSERLKQSSPLPISYGSHNENIKLSYFPGRNQLTLKQAFYFMAGRGLDALVIPASNVLELAALVLVVTREELSNFISLYGHCNDCEHYGFLVIEADDLLAGSITRRRKAAMIAAYTLNHERIVMCDDNIGAVYFKDSSELQQSPSDSLFRTLVEEQDKIGEPIVSVSTLQVNGHHRAFSSRELGSKLFMFNVTTFREKLDYEHVSILFPENEFLWGEDYLMQIVSYCLHKNEGLQGFHIFSRTLFQLERAFNHQNLCKKRGVRARLLEVPTDAHPIYIEAVQIFNRSVCERIESFNQTEERRSNYNFAAQRARELKLRYQSPLTISGDFSPLFKQNLTKLLENINSLNTERPLYPHQVNALKFLSTTLSQHAEIENKITFNIATGCGKTLILAMIAFQAWQASSNRHIVIVSPTIPLVLQTRDALLRILMGYFNALYPILAPHILAVCAGAISSRAFAVNHSLKNGGHILVICQNSFYELVNQAEFISRMDLLILDESHLVEKDKYDYIMRSVQASKALKLCFSATPKLDMYYQYTYTCKEGIRDRILTPLMIDETLPPNTKMADLLQLLKHHKHPQDNKSLYAHKGIIYVKSIKEAEELAFYLTNTKPLDVPIYTIHSRNPKNRKEIEIFESSSLGIAIAVRMLIEGYDDSKIDWAIAAKDLNEDSECQMIGRVLRKNSNTPSKIALIILQPAQKARLREIHQFPPDVRVPLYQPVSETLLAQQASRMVSLPRPNQFFYHSGKQQTQILESNDSNNEFVRKMA